MYALRSTELYQLGYGVFFFFGSKLVWQKINIINQKMEIIVQGVPGLTRIFSKRNKTDFSIQPFFYEKIYFFLPPETHFSQNSD